MDILKTLTTEFALKEEHVQNVISLLDEVTPFLSSRVTVKN